MPVRASSVGTTTTSEPITCSARWLMAYVAGLGLDGTEHFDTTRENGVVSHPLFPVAVEWRHFTGDGIAPDLGVTRGEARRGVHAGHELHLYRAVRQDEVVTLTATVVGVESTRIGARVTVRFDATKSSGELVWTTWFILVYRDVEVAGDDVAPPCDGRADLAPVDAGSSAPLDRRSVPISRLAAHVYTECARIWNPIHTDRAAAVRAGLPGPILHGTASLAHGVTCTLDMIGARPEQVQHIGGSFRAMVLMPARLSVELLHVTNDGCSTVARFEVQHDKRGTAVRDGLLIIGAELPGN